MRTLEDAIKEAGGITAAAKSAGVSPQRLSNWLERGVPTDECATVDAKLGVARWHLRPDDWHRIWPELVNTKGAPKVPAEKAGA